MSNSELQQVSKIGFGGAGISGEGGGYGFGAMSSSEAEKLLKSAWEKGLTLFDTAPIYGFGLSEERMGAYLPKEAFIVTKGGVGWHENRRVNMSNDPKQIEEMLLASLKRLRREVIDLYMIHWPDEKTDIRRPMEVLKRYQERGVIKYLGLCNTHAEDLGKAQEIVSIVALQSEVNLFKNGLQGFEAELMMGWGTFDKGILSGRVHEGRTYDKEDARSWAPWWNKKEVQEKVQKVRELSTLLEKHGLSLKKFALDFSLRNVDCSLVGVKSENDLKDVLDLLENPVSSEVIEDVLRRWRP